MSNPIGEVRKVVGFVPVSREMLLAHGLTEPTPEEQREFAASRAEMQRRADDATRAWPRFVAALGEVADPIARVVLDLHKADEHGHCRGCEFSGYEAEPPGWPCETTAAVAIAVGIDVPDDLHLAQQYCDW